MGTTGQTEIRTEAERYAREEMGRAVQVTAVLDHGSHALALCSARDGEDSFSLLLAAGIATHDWYVAEETDVEDFSRAAHSDNAFEAARLAAELMDGPEQAPSAPPSCYVCDEPVDGSLTRTVDMDPGDAEVGPAPDVQDVPVCPVCWAKDSDGFVVRLAGGAFLGGPKARYYTRFDAAQAAGRAGYEVTSTPLSGADAVIERADRS